MNIPPVDRRAAVCCRARRLQWKIWLRRKISFHDCGARHDNRHHCARAAMELLPIKLALILA
jgi:hypothetical protein